jgi:ATP-dependent RNA helicase RhlE
LPNVPDAYVHRIGRTARAGKDGAAIAFCAPDEMDLLKDIEKTMKISIPVASGTAWVDFDGPSAKSRSGMGGGGGGRGKGGGGGGRGRPAGGGKPGGGKPGGGGGKPGGGRRRRSGGGGGGGAKPAS